VIQFNRIVAVVLIVVPWF